MSLCNYPVVAIRPLRFTTGLRLRIDWLVVSVNHVSGNDLSVCSLIVPVILRLLMGAIEAPAFPANSRLLHNGFPIMNEVSLLQFIRLCNISR